MGNYKHRVVITGIGVVAGNGNTRESFFQAICEGQTGLGDVKRIDMSEYRTQIAGEADVDLPELQTPDDIERTVALSFMALDEALEDSRLTSEQIAKLGRRAGLAFATTLGGTLRMKEHLKQELEGHVPAPEWVADMYLYPNLVARRAGVQGPCSTTVTACASGTAAAGVAMEMVGMGRVDLMIVGGADPLAEFAMAGFHSLKSLSPTGSKPFDQNRDGLILGEGASILVLERLDHALARGAHIYCEVLGYGISNDAYHMTSPDPEGGGAMRAMTMALEDAGLTPADIDYINAHGTATPYNDAMEIAAISKIFGERAKEVYISSTKSMTGHTLGAAGTIEMAISALAIERNIVPPTSTLEEPEFEGYNFVKKQGIPAEINVVMSNSFAFAGNTACVIVSRYEE